MAVTRRPGADHCGIAAAMSVIDGKWKVSLLWELEQRPRRFGELRRLVPGVSEKVLAAQLRELETDGIVHREVYDEVPPRVGVLADPARPGPERGPGVARAVGRQAPPARLGVARPHLTPARPRPPSAGPGRPGRRGRGRLRAQWRRGRLVLTAFGDGARPEGRQFHLTPGPDCPFCLLEEQMRELVGAGDPLLDEYRAHLATGGSRHLLVRRPSPADPWTGRLRTRAHYRVPARRPSCPVHDPLLGVPAGR